MKIGFRIFGKTTRMKLDRKLEERDKLDKQIKKLDRKIAELEKKCAEELKNM